MFNEVPCIAGFINDVVVVVEDGDREFVAAQIFPSILDRVQFWRVGRQAKNGSAAISQRRFRGTMFAGSTLETNRWSSRKEDFWFIVAARSEDETEIRAG